MVWVGIFFDSRMPLVVIGSICPAQCYVDNILRPILLPFLLRHPELTFQQYNAWPHPHMAHIAYEYS